MENPIERWNKQWERARSIADLRWTKYAALATLVIAFCNFIQLGVMWYNLSVMKGNLTLAQQSIIISREPKLRLRIHPDLAKESTTQYDKTEEGGERWVQPYFIFNVGENTAHAIRYFHQVTYDSIIPNPTASNLRNDLRDRTLWTNEKFYCGEDSVLRQDVIDHFRQKKALFRHFFVVYQDEFGIEYTLKAIWRLDAYTVGQPVSYEEIVHRRLPDWKL